MMETSETKEEWIDIEPPDSMPEADSSIVTCSDGTIDGSVLDGGEMEILLQSLDEPCAPLAPSVESALHRSLSGILSSTSGDSYYGLPLSPEDAEQRMPQGDGGLTWYALVIPDLFFSDGRLIGGLNKRDFDTGKQEIKPRRPSLPMTASSLLDSLTKIDGENGPRYIFHGVLNGWPALRCFELVSLEQRRQSTSMIPSPKEILSGQILWMTIWRSNVEGTQGIAPALPNERRIHRAILRGAPWTARGL